ncbi:MAG: hypothetical protein U0797_29865 [Gemmataceae bacterium]
MGAAAAGGRGGTLLLAALLASAGVGGVLHEWRRAEAERDQAERQRDLARNASLEASERAEAEGAGREGGRRLPPPGRGSGWAVLVTAILLRLPPRPNRPEGRPARPGRVAAQRLPARPARLGWHQLAKTFLQDPVPCVGHDGPAWAVAWSGDGKTLVTGGLDGTLRV